MKKVLVFVLIVFLSVSIYSQHRNLYFNDNGTFKVLQLTDIHWNSESLNNEKNLKLYKALIEQEKPNLVVLTGDIVTDGIAKKGWKAISDFFEAEKTPWTLAFGNHDHELELTKIEIENLLNKNNYFIGYSTDVSGVLNHVLKIRNRKTNKVGGTVFILDSHSYTTNPKFGKYDWIKLDQINWLKNITTSEPVPSILFFHIPLLEFSNIKNLKEPASPSDINSGLFAQLLSQPNIMGIFCGHDHLNQQADLYLNKILAYGHVSGIDAYGKDNRGGRVITLHENNHQLETYLVWNRKKGATFYYPAGLYEVDPKQLLPALDIDDLKPGVIAEYYEGKISTVKDITKLYKISTKILPNVNINQARVKDHFAYRFTGYIYIPKTNNYRFNLTSDDGSVLYIDRQLVVDNDGGHSTKTKEATIALEKGYHTIEVLYFEDYMGEYLDLTYESIGLPESKLTIFNNK